jgi:hypothetical protein
MPISVSIDFGMITPDELPSFRMATRIAASPRPVVITSL